MNRQNRSLLAIAVATLLLVTTLIGHAWAETVITAKQALQGVENGTTILVDIRSRAEWEESGIASVAVPLSMHEPGFVQGINRLQAENPGKTIALICAVGGRTAYMSELLARRGFENVADVSEGMFGGRNGAGWIPSGLPVKRWSGE